MAKKKKNTKKANLATGFLSYSTKIGKGFRSKTDKFLERRTHRSFRLTKRRDYVKPLELPGYWAFTNSVFKFLKKNIKTMALLTLTYAVMTGLMVGLASQENYETVSSLLRDTGGQVLEGDIGQIGEATILLTTILSDGVSSTLTESQQIYAALIGLMTWLTTVWLIRNILSDGKPKLRDGLYNSGAPILPTALVSLVLVIQLLPVAVALIGYAAAAATGLLDNGIEAMLFWVAAGLLSSLSIYWMTSTFMALIIVTLPGMYPIQAIRVAGDLVVGRRIRILLRMLWMALGVIVTWAVVMIPLIIFDTWLKTVWTGIGWLPIVPLAMLAISSLTIVWTASYVYMLYRKIIDNDSSA